jgi:hypothetical protein
MECTITEGFGKEKNFLATLDKNRAPKSEDRIQKKKKKFSVFIGTSDFFRLLSDIP